MGVIFRKFYTHFYFFESGFCPFIFDHEAKNSPKKLQIVTFLRKMAKKSGQMATFTKQKWAEKYEQIVNKL